MRIVSLAESFLHRVESEESNGQYYDTWSAGRLQIDYCNVLDLTTVSLHVVGLVIAYKEGEDRDHRLSVYRA